MSPPLTSVSYLQLHLQTHTHTHKSESQQVGNTQNSIANIAMLCETFPITESSLRAQYVIFPGLG